MPQPPSFPAVASVVASATARPPGADAAMVLGDGSVFWGRGAGAVGEAVGEVCFNTAMTGYQEILTDPSYAGQILTFTFPHIGNVGANPDDIEAMTPAVRGLHPPRGHYRSLQLAGDGFPRRLARVSWPGRRYRHRHAPADAAHPRRRRPGRRADQCRCRRRRHRRRPPGRHGRRLARPRGHGPGPGGDLPPDLRLGRDDVVSGEGLRPPDPATAPRGGGGLWRQAQHPALPRRRRLPRHRGAGGRRSRRHPGPPAGRRLPLQRPRRSGGHRRPTPCPPCKSLLGRAASRSSASAWATRSWPSPSGRARPKKC